MRQPVHWTLYLSGWFRSLEKLSLVDSDCDRHRLSTIVRADGGSAWTGRIVEQGGYQRLLDQGGKLWSITKCSIKWVKQARLFHVFRVVKQGSENFLFGTSTLRLDGGVISVIDHEEDALGFREQLPSCFETPCLSWPLLFHHKQRHNSLHSFNCFNVSKPVVSESFQHSKRSSYCRCKSALIAVKPQGWVYHITGLWAWTPSTVRACSAVSTIIMIQLLREQIQTKAKPHLSRNFTLGKQSQI